MQWSILSLLTDEVWDGHGPLAYLMAGGEQLGDDEESPLRWFAPEETNQIHHVIVLQEQVDVIRHYAPGIE